MLHSQCAQVLSYSRVQFAYDNKMSPFLRLAALLVLAGAVVAAPAASDCTGTISSLDDVDDAVKCTTVVINSFTVPAGETLNLDLDRKSTRLNSSHSGESRMPSSA